MGVTTFTDTTTFVEALAPLRESLFQGTDLTYDASEGTMTLVLCRRPSHGPAVTGRGERVVVTVRGAGNYRQSLTHGAGGLYALDRVEVGRGGLELAFYFRPGDRAVMDVERLDGRLEATGRTIHLPGRPPALNPLAEAPPRKGFLGRLLGR